MIALLGLLAAALLLAPLAAGRGPALARLVAAHRRAWELYERSLRVWEAPVSSDLRWRS